MSLTKRLLTAARLAISLSDHCAHLSSLSNVSTAVSTGGGGELAQVGAVAAQCRRTEAAQAAGYDLVPDLDYCFENPTVGAMGYHYMT